MQTGPSFIKKLEAVPMPARAKRPINLLLVIIQDFLRCDLLKQASAMAYVTLLSLIPSLVAVFCVLSLFSPMLGTGGSLVNQAREFVLSNLASGSGEQVIGYLDRMIASLDLKKIGWSSFASVLVTLILLLRQIEEALNRIWLVRKGRNIFTRFMYFWTFLTLGAVVVAIIVGASSGFNLRGLVSFRKEVANVAPTGAMWSWISGWSGSFVFFFFLYKFVPNCFVGARPAAGGAALSATVITVASTLYGVFVRDAKNYQTLYGAIAQLPIFLMWLYICWIIILPGALIAWRFQEGFPEAAEEDTLDNVQTPVEALRNAQVKSMLPAMALIAIYRNFLEGTGRGLPAQDLAHALKLPMAWVTDALDALESLGYIIASKTQTAVALDDTTTVLDPYYPAYPADTLTLSRLSDDLGRPLADWMAHWQYEVAIDLPKALAIVTTGGPAGRDLTLAEALKMAPWRPPQVAASQS